MNDDEDCDDHAREIRYWLWQACITLLAGFITSQNIRHGTLSVKPTVEDIGYALLAFAIIFIACIGVTRFLARFNARADLEERGGGGES